MNNLKKISSILMIIILVLNFVPLELLEYINVVSYAEDIIIPEADWRDVYPPDKKMRNKPIVGFDIELVGEGTKSALNNFDGKLYSDDYYGLQQYFLSNGFGHVEKGSKIKIKDTSYSRIGANLKKWDLQIRRGTNDGFTQEHYSSKSQVEQTITLNETGTWYIFLNVMDDYMMSDSYRNWAENGQWRTEYGISKGWYFAVFCIEVVDKNNMPPTAEFEIEYNGDDVTDNDYDKIQDSLPLTVDLIDKSSSNAERWEWSHWSGGKWNEFSSEQNPTFDVNANVKGFRLKVWNGENIELDKGED